MLPVLIVDNLSPFTPDIEDRVTELEVDCERVEFSLLPTSRLTRYSAIILSGRRKNSKEINSANSKITKYCIEKEKPLLGICYGAEIIALTLGGTIRRMQAHVHGNAAVAVKEQNPLTGEKRLVNVYESHAFCVARLPADFISLASSEQCEHEIFSHSRKPIFGTQFHPEKSGNDGRDLIRNFLRV